VLRVFVTAASVPEREGKRVLRRVKRMDKSLCRLTTIWVDGGFVAHLLMWVMDVCRWIVQVVLRRSFVLLKKRWVVERTFGWLMGCRRLVSRR